MGAKADISRVVREAGWLTGFVRLLLVVWSVSAAPCAGAAQQNAPIVFGGVKDFAPLESLDSVNQPRGFHIELMRAIARVMDRPVEFRLGEWSSIKEEFLGGTIDVVGMADLPARREYALFGTPYTVMGSEVFIRSGGAPINSPEDLAGKDILLEAGAAGEEWLRAHVPGVQITVAPTQADALRALAAGQHDAVVAPASVGRAMARRLGLTNVTTTGPFLFTTPYALCVTPGHEELLRELDQAIEVLKQTGEYGRLYDRWLGEVERPAVSLRRVVAYGSVAAGVFLVLAVGSLLWGRSLRTRVEHRTAQLREQLEARERLEAQRSLMIAELDHRVKNSLAAVLGMAQGMLADNPDPHEFHVRFTDRVGAMASAHEALAKSQWQGVPLAQAIRTILGPYARFGANGHEIECENITLPPELTTPVCLALHELAVNAATHGTLHEGRGRLQVTAARASGGRVEIVWRESRTTLQGVPQFGFGLSLVQGMIESQARGRLIGSIETGTLVWRLELPGASVAVGAAAGPKDARIRTAESEGIGA